MPFLAASRNSSKKIGRKDDRERERCGHLGGDFSYAEGVWRGEFKPSTKMVFSIHSSPSRSRRDSK